MQRKEKKFSKGEMGFARDMIENLPAFIEYKIQEMKLPK